MSENDKSKAIPQETLERFNAYFLTTPNGKKVHETVLSFWHSDLQRFMINEIQEAFEQWLAAQ